MIVQSIFELDTENEFLERLKDRLRNVAGLCSLQTTLEELVEGGEVLRLPAELFTDSWEDYRDSRYVIETDWKTVIDLNYRREYITGNYLHGKYFKCFNGKHIKTVLNDDITLYHARISHPYVTPFTDTHTFRLYEVLYRIQSTMGYEYVFENKEYVKHGKPNILQIGLWKLLHFFGSSEILE